MNGNGYKLLNLVFLSKGQPKFRCTIFEFLLVLYLFHFVNPDRRPKEILLNDKQFLDIAEQRYTSAHG